MYADTTPAGRRALPAALLAAADTPPVRDDAPSRYVVLREAYDTAVAAADLTTALRAASELGRLYDGDPLPLKATAITRLAPRMTQSQDAALAAANGLVVLRAMARREAYADLRKLAPVVRDAANASRNPSVT